MSWLRPENITADRRSSSYVWLKEFGDKYGRIGKIILEAYEEVDPLESWMDMHPEDYYLGYAEELIQMVLTVPFEWPLQQEIRESLVEATLAHCSHARGSGGIIAWLITERVNGNDVSMDDWPG